jgi:hypothetical protein
MEEAVEAEPALRGLVALPPMAMVEAPAHPKRLALAE